LNQGIDQIPCKILKAANPYIIHPLVNIINSSFTSGTFSDKLKISKVIPLHKKCDKGEASNYSPVSIPSNFSKIYENAFLQQLTKFLSEHKKIDISQHALIKSRSTTKDA
jgi:hypothetical protein